MYKQILFISSLLFASTATAECYLVNGEHVCVSSVGGSGRPIETLSNVLNKRSNQNLQNEQLQLQNEVLRLQILQQQINLRDQKLSVVKSSLASIPENERTPLLDELNRLPPQDFNLMLELLTNITEQQRLEVLNVLKSNPKENILQFVVELKELARNSR